MKLCFTAAWQVQQRNVSNASHFLRIPRNLCAHVRHASGDQQ